jgi:hypothetical protein
MKYKEMVVFAPSPTKTLQWSATDGGAQPGDNKHHLLFGYFRLGGNSNVIKAGSRVVCVLLFVCTSTVRVCWLSSHVSTSFLLSLVYVSFYCLPSLWAGLFKIFIFYILKKGYMICIFAVYILRLPVFCFSRVNYVDGVFHCVSASTVSPEEGSGSVVCSRDGADLQSLEQLRLIFFSNDKL